MEWGEERPRREHLGRVGAAGLGEGADAWAERGEVWLAGLRPHFVVPVRAGESVRNLWGGGVQKRFVERIAAELEGPGMYLGRHRAGADFAEPVVPSVSGTSLRAGG